MLTLTTGTRAAERPDGEPRTKASWRLWAPAARGLLAIFALTLTALVAGPDAAHADTSADLWCSMSPQSPKATPGASISVTVTCGNQGPDTSDNSLLVYTYPAGTTLGPLPSGWGSESGTAAGMLISFASGETRQYTFTVIVPASATAGSTMAQEIRGLPGTTDPNAGNDVASGQLSVVKPAVPASAAPSRTSAPPTHRPTTKPTATPSVTTSPATGPASSATVTASSTVAAADQTQAAMPLASDAAGPPTAGSGPTDGPRSSLLALVLIVVGAVLIVGGAVAALLLRRNRPGPTPQAVEPVVDHPGIGSWQP